MRCLPLGFPSEESPFTQVRTCSNAVLVAYAAQSKLWLIRSFSRLSTSYTVSINKARLYAILTNNLWPRLSVVDFLRRFHHLVSRSLAHVHFIRFWISEGGQLHFSIEELVILA